MSDKLKIYLAGAMGGKTLEEMNTWRNSVYNELYKWCKNQCKVIDPAYYYNTHMDASSWDYKDKEYIRWELRNVKNCNLVIARVEDGFCSLGTMSEITTAYNFGIPIILLVDNKITQELHPFIDEMCDKKFDDITNLAMYISEYYARVI